jgi:SNF2 family DNA or RNA helicase
VLKELPPKQRIVLPVDIDNRREYERAKKDFLEWVEDRKGEEAAEKAANAKALVKIGALKALVSEGKLKAAKQWISDFLRESSEKLVVFCYHRNLFNRLKEVYPNAAFGGKAGEERQKEINRFQNDPECRLFIGTIKADNTGITLTAASTTLFLELGWTPADHDQAEDRVNRIGQEADSISAYYLLAKDTIEEYVWELLEKKREICSAILDGNRKSQMALKFLFDNLKEK